MKEKKQFFIPRNYDKQFSFIPGVQGWKQFIFLPIAGLDFLFIKYTGFSFSDKVIVCAVSLATPWMLLGNHPIRPNVPLYKHLKWRLEFLARQRKFTYRKEGYDNVEVLQLKREIIKEKCYGFKEAAASKEIHSRLNSGERDRGRVLNHTEKQDHHAIEGVGNKS